MLAIILFLAQVAAQRWTLVLAAAFPSQNVGHKGKAHQGVEHWQDIHHSLMITSTADQSQHQDLQPWHVGHVAASCSRLILVRQDTLHHLSAPRREQYWPLKTFAEDSGIGSAGSLIFKYKQSSSIGSANMGPACQDIHRFTCQQQDALELIANNRKHLRMIYCYLLVW